ncbi:MAG: hypothetical protein FWC89_10255 [Defluviitaleaceae bacterium]|nr:hypothetical protein [Defluviitaleaceae bacterium]
MSKDDKIIQMLENLTTKVQLLEDLTTKVDKMETKLDKMEVKVDKMEILVAEIPSIKSELTEVKSRLDNLSESVAVIEVEHGQQIRALYDGQSLMSDNIKQLLPVVELAEKTAMEVSVIKLVVTGHAKALKAFNEAM